ncbi:hypothetical protein [Sinorhizobium meliloti]|uniref:Trypsin-like peptidase domain-containing protein n=1 Tax=Rhizobium meliloti TaxID=382 RepID=A0AAW9TLK7_RHIML|nr:hypothetical protein [Sinorhizobium meliloti]MQW33413.1 hypothetical protein [Sinorhizobium meliloti]
MKRFRASALGLIFVAATGFGAASQECEFQKPSDSVFNIVDDKRAKVGTAVLVDAQQGLFLTAFHLLGSPKLRLQGDKEEWEFTKLIGGGNSANLYEDWAIITIGEGKLPLHEGIHLVYDMPSPESLRKAGVYNSSQSVADVGSVRWNDTIQDGKPCSGKGVTFLRIPDYDKGDSGSPLFSADECGIVGLSSRFILEDDAPDAQQKEVVQLFEQFSQSLPDEHREMLSKQASLEGKQTVVRELLKNEMYVKIVPTKCVLDEVVDETFFQNNQAALNILQRAVREEIRDILDEMSSIDLNSARSISRFARMVFKQSLRWPEIVYMWNKYQRGKGEGTLESGILSSSLRTAIESVSSTRKFSYIYTAYQRPAIEPTTATPPTVTDGHGGLDLSQFIKNNINWDRAIWVPGGVRIDRLNLGPIGSSTASGSQLITAGLDILKLLNGLPDEDRRNDDLMRFYKDTAATLITSGLSRPEVGPETRSEALHALAALVAGEAVQSDDPALQAKWKLASDLWNAAAAAEMRDLERRP